MRAAVVLAYAAMCAIWGTTWLAIKFALHGLPPVTGSGARFILAGLFLYGAGRLWPVRERGEAPPLRLIVILAITMFGLNYALTYYAETELASGLVAVLFGTLPFFLFGLGAVMLGERVAWRTIVAAAIALVGVGGAASGGNWTHIAATLVAALSSAYANVELKRYAHLDPFRTLAPAMLLAGIVMLVGGALLEHVDWHAAGAPSALGALVYLAVFGSGIAFVLNHWLLRTLATWIVGLSALIIPVLAVTVGAVFGGEAFSVRELAGALLVIGGVWLAISQRNAVALVPEN
jgi:drug/metabolite transporter (DMT)-like permease